jgi:hypothetical protein
MARVSRFVVASFKQWHCVAVTLPVRIGVVCARVRLSKQGYDPLDQPEFF